MISKTVVETGSVVLVDLGTEERQELVVRELNGKEKEFTVLEVDGTTLLILVYDKPTFDTQACRKVGSLVWKVDAPDEGKVT